MVDTKKTRSQLEAIFADSQANGAITAQDVRDFLISVNLINESGVADYVDDLYTSSSPFSLSADVTYELPCNTQITWLEQEPSDITDSGGFFIPTYLSVSNASGFTVGETITGSISSATGDITSLDLVNNRVYLENIDFSLTGGTYFQDSETITGGTSSNTATVSGNRVKGKITGRNGDGINILTDLRAKPTTGSTTRLDIWYDITNDIGTPANLANLYERTITLNKGQNIEHGITVSQAGYCRETFEVNGAICYVRANNPVDIYEIRHVLTRTHKAK